MLTSPCRRSRRTARSARPRRPHSGAALGPAAQDVLWTWIASIALSTVTVGTALLCAEKESVQLTVAVAPPPGTARASGTAPASVWPAGPISTRKLRVLTVGVVVADSVQSTRTPSPAGPLIVA